MSVHDYREQIHFNFHVQCHTFMTMIGISVIQYQDECMQTWYQMIMILIKNNWN